MLKLYGFSSALIGLLAVSQFFILDDIRSIVEKPYQASNNATQSTTAVDTLPQPCFPSTPYDYNPQLPAYYTNGPVGNADNTPANNPITDEGANLGRVLFYDIRLSANNTVSCASCHQQANGFTDPLPLSVGFDGGLTGRNSMGLTNARFYQRGHFFWDERANTLEDQVLQPIQDMTEMGMTLPALESKLAATSFYPQLFEDVFGDTAITSNRISLALSQFVRSLTSYQSKYDVALTAGPNGTPDFAGTFTAQEEMGRQLFVGGPNGGGANSFGCDRCHGTDAHISPNIENNGLDATITDVGAGNGRFKSPSLRNIAVRGTFMHDGRFSSLEDVLDFYSTGIQNNPGLSPLLRVPAGPNAGQPVRFNMTQQEKDALIAFFGTLTDTVFLTDPKFSDPFCFTVDQCYKDVFESNDMVGDAKPLPAIGVLGNAGICPQGDQDWFSYTVGSKPYLKITLSDLPSDFDLWVFDETGLNQLEYSSETGITEEVIYINNLTPGEKINLMVAGKNGAWDADHGYELKVHARSVPFSGLIREDEETRSEITTIEADFSPISSFKAYPNPTQGDLFIKFTSAERGTGTLTISDLKGQVIRNKEITIEEGGNEVQATLTGQAAGVYVLTIRQNGIRESLRIIKQ